MPLVLKESDIERTVSDYLALDGWRCFKMEQQWSDKKRKTVGECGMPDQLCIRYFEGAICFAQVLWIEHKRITKAGKTTKASAEQLKWHRAERIRGAIIWLAGIDYPATIEGFLEHYRASGLNRRPI